MRSLRAVQLLMFWKSAREVGGSNLADEEAGAWALSEEALSWAKSTVWSRAFNISYLGAAQNLSAMICTLSCRAPAHACMLPHAAPKRNDLHMRRLAPITHGCTPALPGGVGQAGIALVPVLDLLDHSPAAHVAWHTGACGTEPFQFILRSGAKEARHRRLAG